MGPPPRPQNKPYIDFFPFLRFIFVQVSTVQSADLIAVLEGGQIMETGTHDELMTSLGHYYTLCMQQGGPSADSKPDVKEVRNGVHPQQSGRVRKSNFQDIIATSSLFFPLLLFPFPDRVR